MKIPKDKNIFEFRDARNRGFRMRLLAKGNPVPDDVIAFDLMETGWKMSQSIHLTPEEANVVACGLLHTVMEYNLK